MPFLYATTYPSPWKVYLDMPHTTGPLGIFLRWKALIYCWIYFSPLIYKWFTDMVRVVASPSLSDLVSMTSPI